MIMETIRKHNIKVQSIEECAKSDWHLCSGRRMNDDDEEGKCFLCNTPVFAHDKFPADGPQPKKICIKCALEHASGEQSFDA